MPARPISNPDFWKNRIDSAKERGAMHLSVYETETMDEIDAAHRAIIERHIGTAHRVLDAGCGYGRLAGWFDPDVYVGIDFSPDFIREAAARNPYHVFIQASANDLSAYDRREFDWAVCVSMRQMVRANLGDEAWDAMQAELLRVADRVLILEYSDPETFEILCQPTKSA